MSVSVYTATPEPLGLVSRTIWTVRRDGVEVGCVFERRDDRFEGQHHTADGSLNVVFGTYDAAYQFACTGLVEESAR